MALKDCLASLDATTLGALDGPSFTKGANSIVRLLKVQNLYLQPLLLIYILGYEIDTSMVLKERPSGQQLSNEGVLAITTVEVNTLNKVVEGEGLKEVSSV